MDYIIRFYRQSIARITFTKVLLIFLLLIFLFVSLDIFNFNKSYYTATDYNRDYLIARNIAVHGEVVMVGPRTIFGYGLSSPLYYYLLALPLVLHDDIVFLGIFNIFLQLINVILVYFLARILFGRLTAFITILFFVFSKGIIIQSSFIWQPYVMHPFLTLSYLLLAIAYIKKSSNALLWSIAIFVFALMLHNSVLGMLPFYSILVLAILWRVKAGFALYASAALTGLVTLFILNIPLVVYWLRENAFPKFLDSHQLVWDISIHGVLLNFVDRIKLIFSYFFNDNSAISEPIFVTSIIAFIILTGLYLAFARNKREERLFFLIFLAGIISFFLVAAIMPESADERITFPVRYFIPIFAPILILIAHLVVGSFIGKESRFKFPLFVFKTALIIFLIFSLLGSWRDIFFRAYITTPLTGFSLSLSGNGYKHLLGYIPDEQINILTKRILDIAEKENRDSLIFFDLRSYWYGFRSTSGGEIFWVQLERIMGERFAYNNDKASSGYSTATADDYIFVLCLNMPEGYNPDDCVQPFLREHPQYILIEEVYKDIWLAKKIVLE